jgi:hypothetical protein
LFQKFTGFRGEIQDFTPSLGFIGTYRARSRKKCHKIGICGVLTTEEHSRMPKMSETIEIRVDIMSEKAAAATENAIWFEEAFMAHHRTVYRVARSVLRDDAMA